MIDGVFFLILLGLYSYFDATVVVNLHYINKLDLN